MPKVHRKSIVVYAVASTAVRTFHPLLLAVQRYWLLHHGTYLAQRWEEDGRGNLYHCADERRGFFTELGVDDGHRQAVALRIPVNDYLLDDYSYEITLPFE